MEKISNSDPACGQGYKHWKRDNDPDKTETELLVKRAQGKVICRQWWDNQGLCEGACYFKGSGLKTCQESEEDRIVSSYKNKLREEIEYKIKFYETLKRLPPEDSDKLPFDFAIELLKEILKLIDEANR